MSELKSKHPESHVSRPDAQPHSLYDKYMHRLFVTISISSTLQQEIEDFRRMIGGYKARSGVGPFEAAKQSAAREESIQWPPEVPHSQSQPLIIPEDGSLLFFFRSRRRETSTARTRVWDQAFPSLIRLAASPAQSASLASPLSQYVSRRSVSVRLDNAFAWHYLRKLRCIHGYYGSFWPGPIMRSCMTTIRCIPEYRHGDPAALVICKDARLPLSASCLIRIS